MNSFINPPMVNNSAVRESFIKRKEKKTGNSSNAELRPAYKTKLEAFLNNPKVIIFMTVITVWALISDDIRQWVVPKSGDDYFSAGSVVCFVLFMSEIILASIAKQDYFMSFFFTLDILSTVTILMDIKWFNDAVLGTGGSAASTVQQTASASRVGARAARVVRIVRLIRLIRVVKLYKHAQQVMNEIQLEDETQEMNPADDQVKRPGDDSQKNTTMQPINKEEVSVIRKLDSEAAPVGATESPETASRSKDHSTRRDSAVVDEAAQDVPSESNVSKRLSDLTIRRVIVLVLAIMISIPAFTPETYGEAVTSYDTGLFVLWQLCNKSDTQTFKVSLDTYIEYNSAASNPLISLTLQWNSGKNITWPYAGQPKRNLDDMRNSDTKAYSFSDNSFIADAIIDISADNQMDSWLGLIRTAVVCVILTVGALLFTQDSNELVLQPIEEMLVKVKRISSNPIEAAQIEEREAFAMEMLRVRGQQGELQKSEDEKKKKGKAKKTTFETEILEKLIVKIGALLALGFGEAGSEIIAKNMAGGDEIDPMIPGKKMMAIFGFCDIRNFTDATEVLQEGVMVFVNEIAEVVHTTVDLYGGSANKNIGDAFLLVWKFSEEFTEEDPVKPGDLRVKDCPQTRQLADESLIAFLKIMSRINTSAKLERYRHHEGLIERLKKGYYNVTMGFGLHYGWAIEGAIGSDFKIDASYLSPNVNMASRLEAATKQFGVPILISGRLRDIMTPETQAELRRIDRVTVKGSEDPIDFYTCDVDFSNLTIIKKETEGKAISKAEKKKLKVKSRLQRKELKQKILDDQVKVSKLFKTDKEIVPMRIGFTQEFKDEFENGVKEYLDGRWDVARSIFEKTMTMTKIPNYVDGPSKTLLEVIHEHGGKPPKDWNGYRVLTEK
eukprot:TRINITY_DN5527_c0_g1_i2.p1 TRINITY_DN5527_c0_g1~~TRINITY_DN5527_c0_g1_i2.p1  ORF type:complete len:896 (+),score=228.61 TRINITY_DN5527_c0_g1_i2:84-2771(+)